MLIVWTHTSLSNTDLIMWMQRIDIAKKTDGTQTDIPKKNLLDANLYPAKTDKTQKPTEFHS